MGTVEAAAWALLDRWGGSRTGTRVVSPQVYSGPSRPGTPPDVLVWLLVRGLVEKIGVRKYRLTDAGRQAVRDRKDASEGECTSEQ